MARTQVYMVPDWRFKVNRVVEPWQRWTAGEIAEDIRSNLITGGNVVTGALLRSVSHRGKRVFIGTDHWAHVEYGTSPHFIKVRTRKVMADRVTVYGKLVKHPGTREYAPVRRATYKRRVLGVG